VKLVIKFGARRDHSMYDELIQAAALSQRDRATL